MLLEGTVRSQTLSLLSIFFFPVIREVLLYCVFPILMQYLLRLKCKGTN